MDLVYASGVDLGPHRRSWGDGWPLGWYHPWLSRLRGLSSRRLFLQKGDKNVAILCFLAF